MSINVYISLVNNVRAQWGKAPVALSNCFVQSAQCWGWSVGFLVLLIHEDHVSTIRVHCVQKECKTTNTLSPELAVRNSSFASTLVEQACGLSVPPFHDLNVQTLLTIRLLSVLSGSNSFSPLYTPEPKSCATMAPWKTMRPSFSTSFLQTP